jgi:hypothetical protein
VKWCLTWYRDFGAEMVVEESIKLHVLHLPTGHGSLPFCDDESCNRELYKLIFHK